jgi:hypothetical protein
MAGMPVRIVDDFQECRRKCRGKRGLDAGLAGHVAAFPCEDWPRRMPRRQAGLQLPESRAK